MYSINRAGNFDSSLSYFDNPLMKAVKKGDIDWDSQADLHSRISRCMQICQPHWEFSSQPKGKPSMQKASLISNHRSANASSEMSFESLITTSSPNPSVSSQSLDAITPTPTEIESPVFETEKKETVVLKSKPRLEKKDFIHRSLSKIKRIRADRSPEEMEQTFKNNLAVLKSLPANEKFTVDEEGNFYTQADGQLARQGTFQDICSMLNEFHRYLEAKKTTEGMRSCILHSLYEYLMYNNKNGSRAEQINEMLTKSNKATLQAKYSKIMEDSALLDLNNKADAYRHGHELLKQISDHFIKITSDKKKGTDLQRANLEKIFHLRPNKKSIMEALAYISRAQAAMQKEIKNSALMKANTICANNSDDLRDCAKTLLATLAKLACNGNDDDLSKIKKFILDFTEAWDHVKVQISNAEELKAKRNIACQDICNFFISHEEQLLSNLSNNEKVNSLLPS